MMERIKTLINMAITPTVVLFVLFQLGAYLVQVNGMAQWMLVVYGVFAIVLMVYLCISDIRLFSPFFIVVLYTIVSHFGFTIVALVQSDMVYQYLNTNRHVYFEYLAQALQIATVGTSFLIIGYKVKSAKIHNKSEIDQDNEFLQNNCKKDKYINFALLVYYVYAFMLLYIALKYNLFSAGYSTVKRVLSSGAVIVHFKTLFWVATLPISVFFDKTVLKKAITPIIIIFFVFMFTGNRNDVLYPLAIGYSLYCYKNKKTSKIVNTVALIILFVINPAISDNRASGDLLGATYSFKFVDAIMEMGGQIRPLTVTLSLFYQGVIPHLWGMSIILPTIADLNMGLLYSGNTFRASLNYIPNILALDNHYGQGYSMISELWLNYGLIGVILICFFIGYKCASVEKREVDDKTLIRYGGWAMMLFYWARNSLQMNFEIVVVTYIMVILCERITIRKR